MSATNSCLCIGVSALMFKSLFGLRYSVSKNWVWCQYAYVEGLVRVAVGNLECAGVSALMLKSLFGRKRTATVSPMDRKHNRVSAA